MANLTHHRSDHKLRVGVFHLGLQHSWQTALAFQEVGQLRWYATTVFYDKNRWPYRLERLLPHPLGAKIRRELRRRYSPAIDSSFLRLHGFWEWAEIASNRLGINRSGFRMNDRGRRSFSRYVARLLDSEPVDVLWGFNGFARDVFRQAKQRGIVCVLDMTVGHYRQLNKVMQVEYRRHPEYFPDHWRPYANSFIERQEEEFRLADLILAGSDFARNTLIAEGVPAERIRVEPYGFDENIFPHAPAARRLNNRALKLLFVGQLSPRKGVHYLLRALDHFPRSAVELTLVGQMMLSSAAFSRHAARVTHIPHVPRTEIPELMAQADCFIFPSLFEGSALAVYEAIGSGLGTIYSTASGHPSPAKTGTCLDEVTEETITNALEQIIASPECLHEWSAASINERERQTWANYRERVRGLIGELTGSRLDCQERFSADGEAPHV